VPIGKNKSENEKPEPEILRGDVQDFGWPPLIGGEDPGEYKEILDRITAAVKPVDGIEEMLIDDVVELFWDCLRLRRLRASYLDAKTHLGLESVLRQLVSNPQQLAQAWQKNEPKVRKDVEQLLDRSNLSIDAAVATTFVFELDVVQRLDQMIASVTDRRYSALREIDRHRASLGLRLRQETERIENGVASEDKSRTRGPALVKAPG
jgi:hypothetical protein